MGLGGGMDRLQADAAQEQPVEIAERSVPSLPKASE